jgi:hypothetical protein
MALTKMTPEEKAKVEKLIRAIFIVTKGAESNVVSTALCACLLGTIQAESDLSPREPVEYCAKHLKTYAQVVWS